jgi:hypothetical protein
MQNHAQIKTSKQEDECGDGNSRLSIIVPFFLKEIATCKYVTSQLQCNKMVFSILIKWKLISDLRNRSHDNELLILINLGVLKDVPNMA